MAAVIKIVINSSSTGGGLRDAAADIERLDGAARNASGKGGGVGMMGAAVAGALGGVAVAAAGAAASAIAGTVSESVSLAGQFEGNMNQFAAAAGGSLEAAGMNVQQFQDLFLQLGAKLPVSTMEVQQAAIALVKGGIDPAIIAAGGLESSLNFASAAGMGLEDAANLSVKMLGTFTSVTDSAATKTEFMADAQNLLVKAANASTLDVATLGDAMLQAGGQAKAVGLDYEDFVTSMGLISPAFGSAAEAGTSFKNFLVRLQPTTDPAITAMTNLGLYTAETGSAFFDAEGKFVGVETAAELLKNSLSGLSDAQRVMALQTIFGNDAMGAAAALADGGSEAYRAFAEQMGMANGVAEQAAAVNQGFDFAMTNLQGTIESLQIQFAIGFLPILAEVINITNNFIQALMGSGDAMNALPGPLQAIVAGFYMLWNGAQSLMIKVGELLLVFKKFGSEALQEIITFVTTGTAEFSAFNTIWETVKGYVRQALQAIISYLQTNLPIWIAALVQWGVALWRWIQDVLPLVIQQLGAWGLQIITWLGDNLPTLLVTLLQWGTAMYKWLAEAIPPLIVELGKFIAAMMNPLDNDAKNRINEWTTNAANALWKWITDELVPQVGPALEQFLGALVTYLGAMLGAIGKAAKSIGGAIMDGITAGINDQIESTKRAIQGAVDAVIEIAKKVLNIKSPSRVFADEVGVPIAQGMAQGIMQGVPMVAQAGSTMAQSAMMGAQSNVTYHYNYSPVYSSTPSNPSLDFQLMRSLARV